MGLSTAEGAEAEETGEAEDATEAETADAAEGRGGEADAAEEAEKPFEDVQLQRSVDVLKGVLVQQQGRALPTEAAAR